MGYTNSQENPRIGTRLLVPDARNRLASGTLGAELVRLASAASAIHMAEVAKLAALETPIPERRGAGAPR
jgi:hypothetical protein